MFIHKSKSVVLSLTLSFAMGASLATGAQAALVSPVKGTTYVDTGNGYLQINGPVEVAEGATVVVSPDGAAQIAYSDNCVIEVKPTEVQRITAISPCRAGGAGTPAAPAAAGAGLAGTNALIIGGVVVAGAIGAAIALSARSDDRSVSP